MTAGGRDGNISQGTDGSLKKIERVRMSMYVAACSSLDASEKGRHWKIVEEYEDENDTTEDDQVPP